MSVSAVEPVVVKFSTSSNVVEGERFRLPCVVYGYPTPKVEWRRGKLKLLSCFFLSLM